MFLPVADVTAQVGPYARTGPVQSPGTRLVDRLVNHPRALALLDRLLLPAPA
ncbi:hypothetical protein [Actinomadura alba]|uniref:Uncharacterized protein n=1 Tax=Actinomadura alba TaxID=406431 RepID=A0ABR7LMV4_9ACTN|nr:hypothetical protein [Actinomadura alba]MBC6466065.1 hypothetical protein [Actinomadura alba]